MNADGAQQCLDISKRAWLEERNYAKALKFARKAESLHSSTEGQRWLARLAKESTDTAGQPSASAETKSSMKSPDPATNSSNSNVAREYSEEQLEAVRKIKKCGKDYYAVLGLPRDCSDVDIKKAYRKVCFSWFARIISVVNTAFLVGFTVSSR